MREVFYAGGESKGAQDKDTVTHSIHHLFHFKLSLLPVSDKEKFEMSFKTLL